MDRLPNGWLKLSDEFIETIREEYHLRIQLHDSCGYYTISPAKTIENLAVFADRIRRFSMWLERRGIDCVSSGEFPGVFYFW